jgi:hypothetical protein
MPEDGSINNGEKLEILNENEWAQDEKNFFRESKHFSYKKVKLKLIHTIYPREQELLEAQKKNKKYLFARVREECIDEHHLQMRKS